MSEQLVCHSKIYTGLALHNFFLRQNLGKMSDSVNIEISFFKKFFQRINIPTPQKILPVLVRSPAK